MNKEKEVCLVSVFLGIPVILLKSYKNLCVHLYRTYLNFRYENFQIVIKATHLSIFTKLESSTNTQFRI